VAYTPSAGGSLYFDITIETNQQELSEDDTEYTLTVELPAIQGKQANNNDPVVRTPPIIKFSSGRRR
jgi:hypothetical protein